MWVDRYLALGDKTFVIAARICVLGYAGVSGLEELLGYIADGIGLKLVGRSRPRIIGSVLFFSILGLVLMIGGLYSLMSYHDGGVAVLSGAFLSILGLAFLIRIAINLTVLFRKRRQSSAPDR
jgi:hypothetical protein